MKIKNRRLLWEILTIVGLIGIVATLSMKNNLYIMIATLWTVVFGSLFFREEYGNKQK